MMTELSTAPAGSSPALLTNDELDAVNGGIFPLVVAGIVITPGLAAAAGGAFLLGIAYGVKWVMCN